jgi:hypothetical protein
MRSFTSGAISLRRAAKRASGDKPLIECADCTAAQGIAAALLANATGNTGTASGLRARLQSGGKSVPSPGGDPDQYEEEQSGKHIAGVYIFEAGPAGWTGIEDCLCPP